MRLSSVNKRLIQFNVLLFLYKIDQQYYMNCQISRMCIGSLKYIVRRTVCRWVIWCSDININCDFTETCSVFFRRVVWFRWNFNHSFIGTSKDKSQIFRVFVWKFSSRWALKWRWLKNMRISFFICFEFIFSPISKKNLTRYVYRG